VHYQQTHALTTDTMTTRLTNDVLYARVVQAALEGGCQDPDELVEALEADIAGWTDAFLARLGLDAVRTLAEVAAATLAQEARVALEQ